MNEERKTLIWDAKPWRNGAKLPAKQTEEAAAYDVYAWTPFLEEGERREIIINPMDSAVIKTGVNLNIPEGYCVDVKSRSGIARKFKVFVMNSDGLIDADYIGEGEDYELGVILMNLGKEPFVVKHLDRIAQIELRSKVKEKLVDGSDKNYDNVKAQRGSNRKGGFGSTGV